MDLDSLCGFMVSVRRKDWQPGRAALAAVAILAMAALAHAEVAPPPPAAATPSAPAPAGTSQTTAQQAEELIGQLGAKAFQQRDEAGKKLLALGRSSDLRPWLEKHADDPDPEVRLRIAAVLKDAGWAPWGEESKGLRCRLLPPEKPVVAGTNPEILIEVENASESPLFWWQAQCPPMFAEPGAAGSWVLAQAARVEMGDGVRQATADEVTHEFNVAVAANNLGMISPGVYRLMPGARLRLAAVVPIKQVTPGRHQIDVEVRRLPMRGSMDTLDSFMRCPPVVLSVVAPGQAAPPPGDPAPWPAGEWGPEVEGAQMRLSAERTFHNPGGVPYFSVDIHNAGTRAFQFSVSRDPAGLNLWQTAVELEVDGTWYKPAHPEASGAVAKSTPFAPGNRYQDLHFTPFGQWGWTSADGKVLRFEGGADGGGQRAFRLALTVQPTDGGKPVRLVTNVLSPPSADKLPR